MRYIKNFLDNNSFKIKIPNKKCSYTYNEESVIMYLKDEEEVNMLKNNTLIPFEIGDYNIEDLSNEDILWLEKYEFNINEDIDNIISIGEQGYLEMLKSQPTLLQLKQEVESLKEQQQVLQESQEVQDFIIDDLVFEVIPSLETQIASDQSKVPTIIKRVNVLTKGMVQYLAKKISEGKNYEEVFKVNAYKQYQEEVDNILGRK